LKISIKVRLVILLTLSAALITTTVSGATPKKITGITISPAFQKVKILGSEPESVVQFMVTNNEPVAQTLHLSGADFSSLNESGGLLFVGTNPTALQKKYGLAKWLSLPQDSITIAPKEKTLVTATIINREDLSPGGHYGALMLTLEPGGSQKNGSSKVAVTPIASSLIFVNKLGGDTHRLKLTNVAVSRRLFGVPGSVTLRFYNDGNTDVTPRGSVVLGKLEDPIKKGIINENSGLILPESYRQYSVEMRKVSAMPVMGTVKLNVNYRFEGYDGFRAYQINLFVISALGLALIALSILAGALSIWWFWNWPAFKPLRLKLRKLSKLNLK
jgi:hypothetical protein